MAISSLGIKTIVFGVSYKSFQKLLPCEEDVPNYEEILSRMNVSMQMIGPVLEDEVVGYAMFSRFHIEGGSKEAWI